MKYKSCWLVDDDRVNRFSIKKLLKKANVCSNIKEFTNGFEAMNKLMLLQNGPVNVLPDLIILDLNMPVWDGWEFIEYLRELNIRKSFKLVILTASVKKDDENKATASSLVETFLVKPLDIEKVSAL